MTATITTNPVRQQFLVTPFKICHKQTSSRNCWKWSKTPIIHSLPQSFTQSFTHSLIHSITHSITYQIIHSLIIHPWQIYLPLPGTLKPCSQIGEMYSTFVPWNARTGRENSSPRVFFNDSRHSLYIQHRNHECKETSNRLIHVYETLKANLYKSFLMWNITLTLFHIKKIYKDLLKQFHLVLWANTSTYM